MIVERNELKYSLEQFVKSDVFALLGVTPLAEYVDGKRTNNITGYRYTVADPQTFKNFEVRVLDASSKITDVTFQDAKGRLWVSFTNAYLTPFSMNFTKVDCKVTADAITLVKKD